MKPNGKSHFSDGSDASDDRFSKFGGDARALSPDPAHGNGSDRSSDDTDDTDDKQTQDFGTTPLSPSGASRLVLIREFAEQNPKRTPAWVAKQLGQPEGKVREALGLPPKTSKPKASNGGEAAP